MAKRRASARKRPAVREEGPRAEAARRIRRSGPAVSYGGISRLLRNPIASGAWPLLARRIAGLQATRGNHYVQRLLSSAPAPDRERPGGGQSATGIIQRAPGLPNKDEAVGEGGKAGYKIGIGKSTYGNLLKALDEFRAVADDDKDAQVTVLSKIQGLIRGWFASGSRASVKTGDAAKRAFLGRIRPLVKILYYEAKTKEEVLEPAEAGAAQNADENAQKIKATLLAAQLDDSMDSISAMLSTLKAAPLTTNFAPDTLNFLIAAPDFKNIWQIAYKDKTPGKALGPVDALGGVDQREDAERYLGYEPLTDVQRENRPAYCAVNLFHNPKGAAPGYGRFHFIFKENLKKRATFTASDTFAMRKDKGLRDVPAGEAIGTSDNLEAVLAHNEAALRLLANLAAGTKAAEKDIKASMAKYIEAQIHGGLSVNDVQMLVVNFKIKDPDNLDWKLSNDLVQRFSTKYGIPVQYTDGIVIP